MAEITLKQLRVFVRIVQEGSVTAAAERLFLTKPAVSSALAELEKRCGQPLFDRRNHRLHLNESGYRLLPLADELLQRGRDIDKLFDPKAMTAVPMNLGCSFTIGHQLVPRLLRDYRRDTGHLRQTARIGNTRQVCALLSDFAVDLGLIEGEPEADDIETETWLSDRMLIAAAPDHPLATQTALGLADLDDNAWVLREKGSGSRDLFMHRVAPEFARWRTSLELNATEAIINATAAGLGLSCISELEARHALKDGRLVEIAVDLDLKRQFHLAWHRQKYRGPTLAGFVEYCRRWHAPRP